MFHFTEIFTVMGVFFLRLGVPLLLTLGVGYLLHRLDARWEAEAQVQKGTAPRPKAELPLWVPQPGLLPILATAEDVFGQPCWEMKNCSPEAQAACPAAHSPETPCWQARYEALGKLPEACYHCEIYYATTASLVAEGPTPWQNEQGVAQIRH